MRFLGELPAAEELQGDAATERQDGSRQLRSFGAGDGSGDVVRSAEEELG